MNNYESVIILSANAPEEATVAFGEKMKELISANGELTNVEEWGRKTLAYEINKQTEGYYILFTFVANPEFIAEFERILRLDEIVLKHMVIRKDKE
ncbi:MAG: 30S ribosomal protein S6 [Clostridia bacterium]|nr:30S ribosomal protein S6 [Clostridia bacterium]